MAGGAKLPRHPSPVTRHSTLSSRRGLESGYPPCVHIWRGGHSTGRYRSLDSLKPVAARLLTPSRERGFDWNIFYPDFESFTRGFFFLYPSFTYFIRNSSLLSWVFFFFFFFFCFTLRSDILPRISAVSPFIHIFYPDFESFIPHAWSHPTLTFSTAPISGMFRVSLLWMGARSHPSFRYFIRTLCLLFRMPGPTLPAHILSRL